MLRSQLCKNLLLERQAFQHAVGGAVLGADSSRADYRHVKTQAKGIHLVHRQRAYNRARFGM